jgi:hypothetical protein
MVVGLLIGLGLVVAVLWFGLSKSGLLGPGRQQQFVEALPRLRAGMSTEEVAKILGKPRETSAREFVLFLRQPEMERSRITLAEAPLEPGTKASQWPPPADKTVTVDYLEEGPHTKGQLFQVRAALTVKNGKWDVTAEPPVPTGGAPRPGTPGADKGPVTSWLYYFRATQNPKSDEGPIRLMVLVRFEGGKLVNVLKVDVDVRGLPKPGGGTY